VDAKENPFIWVQSLEKKDLAFLSVDPFLFRPDYELDIDDSLLQPLALESPSDVIVLSLITIPADGGSITVNLQGPLVINKKNNRAMQAILTDPRWQTKHDLLAEASVNRGVQ
jgi:flagellar assembly factor FliW